MSIKREESGTDEETKLQPSKEETTEMEGCTVSAHSLHGQVESMVVESSESLPRPVEESTAKVTRESALTLEHSVSEGQQSRSSSSVVPQEETVCKSNCPNTVRSYSVVEDQELNRTPPQITLTFNEKVDHCTFIVSPHTSQDQSGSSHIPEMSVPSSEIADPQNRCRFSTFFQDTTWKIQQILKEDKTEEYVLHMAKGLTTGDPDEKIFPEAKGIDNFGQFFCACTDGQRWSWMDFYALRFLLEETNQHRALRELQKYQDQLQTSVDKNLRPLRENPPVPSDGCIVDLKDECDENNLTPRQIIKHKKELAKSLQIGLESFSLTGIYKGCMLLRFRIPSAVTAKKVRQRLLQLGARTEDCTEGCSVVTYLLPSPGCICAHSLMPHGYDKEELTIRDRIIGTIRQKCQQHGAKHIETSQIVDRRNLEGKYFHDAKESEVICYLADDEQESERLALRIDLTISFALYLAENQLKNLKRYEFGKVFLKGKDTSALKEMYQIDFDIAGESDLMATDAECLRTLSDVLTALKLNDFIIRVNHLNLLKGILTASGISQEKIPAALSCLKKSENHSQDLVASGFPCDVVERAVGYMKCKGGHNLIDELKQLEALMKVGIFRESLSEMSQLMKFCKVFKVPLDKVLIDLSLLREYDYYTGLMFDASVMDGSVCVSKGGRYDDLVDKFREGFKVPCVGFTLNVLAIVDLMRRTKSEVVSVLPSKDEVTPQVVLTPEVKDKVISSTGENIAIEDDSQSNDEVKEHTSRDLQLKNPKGMRDYNPHDMMLRSKIIKLITGVYKKHGAVTIDTPALELKDVLMGKYGEESKLIYDLEDQGGETQSLRYDLTVPFARYLATNRKHYMKRYQIDKVYRRDKPSIRQGRCREMYQCDFDIAGDYDLMLPDAECIRIVSEILTLPELGLGDIVIKVNHRKLLDGMFEACGVPGDKFHTICSAVDKLDKNSWENVREEMLSKGLSPEVADRVYDFVGRYGKHKLLEELQKDPSLVSVPAARQGLEELLLLLEYCKAYGVINKVMVDLSLARGLDYYTGVIFEAKLLKGNEEEMSFGSLCGGGRYDDLVASFDPKGQFKVPCVGFSIGLERIFNILESRNQKDSGHKMRTVETEVYVVTGQKDMLTDRMSLCAHLWDHGIKTEMSYKANPKMLTQFQYCEREGIPFQVIIGEEEKEHGSVKIRDTVTKDELLVKRDEVVHHLKKKLEEKKHHHH